MFCRERGFDYTVGDHIREIFVVWKAYQARVENMQAQFGYHVVYLGNKFRRKVLRPVDYIWKSFFTLYVITRYRPEVLWLQLPPAPLLYVAALTRFIHRRIRFVFDCHNALFRRPWIDFPFLMRLLNTLPGVVVTHNSAVAENALRRGIRGSRLYVLCDYPAVTGVPEASGNNETQSGECYDVIFPASFSNDEPMDLVFSAANQMPDIRFVITGEYWKLPACLKARVPKNVYLTGWVDVQEFRRLLQRSRVVLGLTIHQDVQLSAASEALGYTKPAVLSDTPVLRELFPAAIHVRNSVESLVKGLREALSNEQTLTNRMRTCLNHRLQEWKSQADELRRALGETEGRGSRADFARSICRGAFGSDPGSSGGNQ